MSGFHGILIANRMPKAFFSAAAVNATKITVTPTNATASITFKRDGSITNHNGTVVAYWTNMPSATIGDRFKVKATKSSGDNFTAEAAANDTYTTDISADRTYSCTETTDGAATENWIGTWTVANLNGTGTSTATGDVKAEVTV